MTTHAFAAAHLGSRYRSGAPAPALTGPQAAVRTRLLDADRPDDWESVSCLCGAEGGRVLTDVDRYGLPYRKVLCPACGLLRLTPRWTAQRSGRGAAR